MLSSSHPTKYYPSRLPALLQIDSLPIGVFRVLYPWLITADSWPIMADRRRLSLATWPHLAWVLTDNPQAFLEDMAGGTVLMSLTRLQDKGALAMATLTLVRKALMMVLLLPVLVAIRVRLLELIPVGASVSVFLWPLILFSLIDFISDGGVGGVQGNGAFAADLAQAQAQLTSLQQFRAAAGGHHHKMPSFSFPNMLPNMMAANMMGLGLGGINLLQQQQQQFQSQLQQQSNQPQRKSLFAPYLPQASLPPLLAAGKLVVGILRVNKRNRSDAYVATEVLDADIYICGSKDRNRALEGDIVAVELLDVDEVWGTKKEKEEKKRKKEENAAYDLKATSGRKDDKKKDDVEVEGQGLMLFEDEEYVLCFFAFIFVY